MKLKSYMRGIGAGMMVAALVVGLSAPKKTVAEEAPKQTVLEAAEEMQLTSSNEEKASAIVEEIPEAAPEVVVSVEPNEELEEDTKDEPSVVVSTEPEPEPEPEVITPPAIDPLGDDDPGFIDNGESIKISVVHGDSSVSVSRRLFEAGLVESAVEFDKFLCDNGYDKSISVGNFEIVPGSDFETIAKILSRRN